MNILGVKQRFSTAYHPQTDGFTERMNQEIETYLHIYCSQHPETWASYLPIAEFAHNTRPHSVTKISPFYALMGFEPRGLPDPLA